MFEIGQKVHAIKMPDDSHYVEVKGVVSYTRHGFVGIRATEVRDRWSREWRPHPSVCACATREENVRLLA